MRGRAVEQGTPSWRASSRAGRLFPPMAKKMAESTKRRVRAGRMLLSGKEPTKVAKAVGVARQTVHTWKGVLDEGGIDALRAMQHLRYKNNIGMTHEIKNN